MLPNLQHVYLISLLLSSLLRSRLQLLNRSTATCYLSATVLLLHCLEDSTIITAVTTGCERSTAPNASVLPRGGGWGCHVLTHGWGCWCSLVLVLLHRRILLVGAVGARLAAHLLRLLLLLVWIHCCCCWKRIGTECLLLRLRLLAILLRYCELLLLLVAQRRKLLSSGRHVLLLGLLLTGAYIGSWVLTGQQMGVGLCCNQALVLQVGRRESNIADHVDLLLWMHWIWRLESFQLLLTHDGLTHVNPIHIAAIAEVSEPKVQVVALQAYPVSNSFHFWLLSSHTESWRIWRILIGFIQFLLLLWLSI